MIIICQESLYHSEFNSRQYISPVIENNLTQEDKRMFVYLWKCNPKYPKSRSRLANNGTAREYVEQVYRKNIHIHTCRNLYKAAPTCNQRQEEEILTNLCVIKDTSIPLEIE